MRLNDVLVFTLLRWCGRSTSTTEIQSSWKGMLWERPWKRQSRCQGVGRRQRRRHLLTLLRPHQHLSRGPLEQEMTGKWQTESHATFRVLLWPPWSRTVPYPRPGHPLQLCDLVWLHGGSVIDLTCPLKLPTIWMSVKNYVVSDNPVALITYLPKCSNSFLW